MEIFYILSGVSFLYFIFLLWKYKNGYGAKIVNKRINGRYMFIVKNPTAMQRRSLLVLSVIVLVVSVGLYLITIDGLW